MTAPGSDAARPQPDKTKTVFGELAKEELEILEQEIEAKLTEPQYNL